MTKLKRGSIFSGKNHGRHNGGRTTIRKRETKKFSLTLNYGRKGKHLFIPTNITHFYQRRGEPIMGRRMVWEWRGENHERKYGRSIRRSKGLERIFAWLRQTAKTGRL